MKKLLPILFITLISTAAVVVDCLTPTASVWTDGNNIRAVINNSGNLFFDGSDAGFQAPSNAVEPTATIFSAGYWFGGIDPGGNLKLAASTYGTYAGSSDYFAGPINPDGSGTINTTCEDWDRIWKVNRFQIMSHLNDLDNNGVIDNPVDEIFGWPANGNIYFENLWGFPLPENSPTLAPFHDQNNNGVYNPESGDFPLPPNVSNEIIPEEITYCLFNDSGGIHSFSNGDNLQFQFGQTSYSFICEESDPLNNTLFISLAFANHALESIDSLHFGMFVDADLGCYTDDFLGSAPDMNTFFFYNATNLDGDIDGNCIGAGGVNGYGENPPVQAVTFLNQPLSSFMYFNNASINGPPASSDPNIAIEYFNYLTGHWRDGSPLEQGGDGYGENTTQVQHAFPDDPNDVEGWSMISENLTQGDRRGIGSTLFPSMQPQASNRIDMAFSYVRVPSSNYLENVTAMYQQVAAIQADYENTFMGDCSNQPICEEDCVWAGDADADGIANHEDLLALGLAKDENGPIRTPPYNWSPVDAESWSKDFLNGTNIKHSDCNGDGITNYSDIQKTIQNYDFINEKYNPIPDVYPIGEELSISPFPPNQSLDNLSPGENVNIRIKLEQVPETLFGMAASLEFEADLFQQIQITALGDSQQERFFSSEEISLGKNTVDFSLVSNDKTLPVEPGSMFLLKLTLKEQLPNGITTSTFRFKNSFGIDSSGVELEIGGNDFEIGFLTTNIEEALFENGVRLSPNPTKGILNLNLEDQQLTNIRVMNTAGKVLSEHRGMYQSSFSLDISHLPSGIYFIQLGNGEMSTTRKIVLNK